MALMRNNENSTVCSLCKGKCCKNGAGGWFPEDLGPITKELIADMLKNGYQLDWWEGNPTKSEEYEGLTAYYLRPQHTNSIGRVKDPSWGGQCIFLGEKGCTKTWEERPTQCKALIPNEKAPGECRWEDKYSKQEITAAWLPYNSIIEETIQEAKLA